MRTIMEGMKPYSEDLRARIVKSVEEGISKSGAARLFDVSLSSVKRYVRSVNQGESFTPRKGGGRPPKTNETTEKLLEEDVEERLTATVAQRCRFVESLTGKSFSNSTVGWLLKRMGFSQKTERRESVGTGRMAESGPEDDARWGN
jgi:transposase